MSASIVSGARDVNGDPIVFRPGESKALHKPCYAKLQGRESRGNKVARTGALTCVYCKIAIAQGAPLAWLRDDVNGARHGSRPAIAQGAPAAPVAFPDETSADDDTDDACAGEGTDDDAPEAPAPVAPAAPLGALEKAIADAILPYVQGRITAGLDARKVRAIVREEIARQPPTNVTTTFEVRSAGGAVTISGRQHKQFATLLAFLASGVNVWITGPAGSGKTTAVHNAARALAKPYRYTGAVGDAFAISGYTDANGKLVRTQFREAFEHGGVFLWDEVDASDPNALLAFNAALANGSAAFPDGLIDRHPECVIAATANTWGQGATASYVGRNRLDAAFLDRFVMLAWETDEDLERETCGDQEWARYVQSVRAAAARRGLQHMITPRASYAGAKLLAQGVAREYVINATLRKGLEESAWNAIKGGA